MTTRGRTAVETRPASDALDREWKAEREQERRDRSQELADRERALQSFLVPRSEDQETREDRERERTSEDSPDSPRCRVCCKERGEATEEAAQARGVRCGRTTSPFPAPEGAKEAEAHSRAPDERPETLPPLSLDRGRAGGEEASRDAAQGASRDPFLLAALLKGGKKKRKKPQGARLLKKMPPQGEARLKGVKNAFCLYKRVSSQKLPTAKATIQHKSHKSCL